MPTFNLRISNKNFNRKDEELLPAQKSKIELADAHAHMNMVANCTAKDLIDNNILTVISNGGTPDSNSATLKLSDNYCIFPALAIGPDAALISEEELQKNINLIRSNSDRIVAIGEAGIDYALAEHGISIEKQKHVFTKMAMLSVELGIPISIHCREGEHTTYSEALASIISILKSCNVEKAHFHFFNGGIDDAKEIERNNYFISVPPLRSAKRMRALSAMPIQNIMAETDAPAVGKSPLDVKVSMQLIAEAKHIAYEDTCRFITENTKAFFNIESKKKPMPYKY